MWNVDFLFAAALFVLMWVIVPFVAGPYLVRKFAARGQRWKLGLALLIPYCAAFGVLVYCFRDPAAPELSVPELTLGILIGCLVPAAPFLGTRAARSLQMPDHGWKIGLVFFCLASGAAINYFAWPPELGIDLSGGVILVYEVENPDEEFDMDQLIAAVKLRVDPSGVQQVDIRPYGPKQIEIKIPRVDENKARRIEKLVSRAGTLQFRILANDRDHNDLIKLATDAKRMSDDIDVVRNQVGNEWGRWIPLREGEKSASRKKQKQDKERVEGILSYREIAQRTVERDGLEVRQVLVFKDEFDVKGGLLAGATVGWDSKTGNPCVDFVFKSEGGLLFGGLTGNNLPDKAQDFYRKLGIILDKKLYSAPQIITTIYDKGQITGSFDKEEAQDLVNVLNAGALPTTLKEEPISKLQTGPTLGRDTIRRGSYAIAISMALVLLFMLFYYRFSGVVACGALLMNLVLILAIMISVKAAFTLPGLAGLVLTVGMAVDANVLVFERIREELARGAALRMAIRNGFSRARTTIVDANLTTLITATVLYWIGTEQVKGFAVILFLGVVLSMFTAIFCSRVAFDVAERRRWISKLGMLRILGTTRIDFLGRRHLAAAVSVLVIVIGLVGVVFRGRGLLDIDFTGGVSVEILFKESQDIAEVRRELGDLPDLVISDVQTLDEPRGLRFLVNTSKSDLDTDEKHKSVREVLDRQLEKLFGANPYSEKQNSAVEEIDGQLTAALEAKSDSEERKAALKAIDRQLKEVFADEPDIEKRNAAIAAVDQQIGEVLLSAIELVRRHIHEVFGPKLAVNSLTIENVDEIMPAGPEPKLASAGESPQPSPAGQTRNDLPDDSVLALADAAPVMPARADPADGDPATGDQPPEARSDAAGPPETPAEPPAKTPSVEKAEKVEKVEKLPAEPPAEPPAKTPSAEKVEKVEKLPAEPPAEPPAKTPSVEKVEKVEKLPAEPPAEPPAKSPSVEKVEKPPAEDGAPAHPFAGRTRAHLTFEQGVDHETLQEMFDEVVVKILNQKYVQGNEGPFTACDVEIMLPPDKAQPELEAIKAKLADTPFFRSSNTIGGKVAGNTQTAAIYALLTSLLCIVGYIWIRFQRVVFGLAAVVALVHDVLVTLGVIALSYWLADYLGFLLIDEFKIGLPVLAAFLTIIGYSLNDTIVVFDRIREVRGKAPRLTQEMVNTSINQTLARTLLTSFTTLIVVLILYVGGGQAIHAFSFSLVIGVLVGTYSSIFVASPALLWMSQSSGSK